MKWSGYSILMFFILGFHLNSAASDDTTTVYLFPGQGSDYRIFKQLSWPKNCGIVYIHYPVPEKEENLKEFSYRFIPLIDTSSPFVLLGVSLGGMICSELADILQAKKVILISSAKHSGELPGRYTFQQVVPLNKAVPGNTVKKGAIVLQPIVEPDSREDLDFFRSMLGKKIPLT